MISYFIISYMDRKSSIFLLFKDHHTFYRYLMESFLTKLYRKVRYFWLRGLKDQVSSIKRQRIKNFCFWQLNGVSYSLFGL